MLILFERIKTNHMLIVKPMTKWLSKMAQHFITQNLAWTSINTYCDYKETPWPRIK